MSNDVNDSYNLILCVCGERERLRERERGRERERENIGKYHYIIELTTTENA